MMKSILDAIVASPWLHSLVVCIGVAALDFSWARYNNAVAAMHIVKSGIFSVLIYLISGFTIIQYIENQWMLVPASIGAIIGTCSSVWLHKRSVAREAARV